ncbi:MAG: hypothetical protein Q8M09_06155 [Pseudomonadota bacterium]|nr:hypothetical protein [Pseudomonadota bacterium]MDP1903812.1 hypothetical protein [Pseudomonadota bacterium]MDP2353753.1 hypothetical protein [Pseudomonadota bacterium]
MSVLSQLLSALSRHEKPDPDLEQALERAAYRVEPHLKHTGSWPKRFRPPLAAALNQAKNLLKGIPGPVEINARSFTQDPFVHALFGSPEDIRTALCSSTVMRQYVASGVSQEVYVLLSMRRNEKNTLGTDDSGGVLRRDVPQRKVWFTDHQLIGPQPTLESARETLKWILFDRFLERVAVGIQRIHTERDRLSQEKDLAQARLRCASPANSSALRGNLEQTLAHLGAATQCLENSNLAEVFATVLSHPEDCLYLEEYSLLLDNMGLVRSEEESSTTSRLTFTDLHERYAEPRTVALIHCQDIRPIAQNERLREAMRWLG